ncbi:Unknown (Se85) [Spodoptera exigua multiple nucleopolyhedrovirus]|nr:Unknown (Se85) [Spodoptera exigua multiple nucleopolyhedrovirus]CDG73264.1 Unknown (Se85) [Spodoptera exigua multiple nucleopolyhedrovirus]
MTFHRNVIYVSTKNIAFSTKYTYCFHRNVCNCRRSDVKSIAQLQNCAVTKSIAQLIYDDIISPIASSLSKQYDIEERDVYFAETI